MELISRYRGGGFIAVVVALAVMMVVISGCATTSGGNTDPRGEQKEQPVADFDLRAYQALGAARIAYDAGSAILGGLSDSGQITEDQWLYAASIVRKVKASIILANAAMVEYKLAKDAGVDAMDAKGKAEHALLVLAKDAALLADQIRVLSGKEAVK